MTVGLIERERHTVTSDGFDRSNYQHTKDRQGWCRQLKDGGCSDMKKVKQETKKQTDKENQNKLNVHRADSFCFCVVSCLLCYLLPPPRSDLRKQYAFCALETWC